MADKLVPGIPHATRIAILQQTDTQTQNDLDVQHGWNDNNDGSQRKVLEYVMGSDRYRNEVIHKMDCKLSSHTAELCLLE